MRIASPKNPKVKAWASLKERRAREETGLFLVEGPREVERALAAGLRPVALLLKEGADLQLAQALPPGAPVYLLSEDALARVSVRENPAPLIGVFPIPQRRLEAVRLPPNPLVLVVLGVEKPGNLGAILRSALGAGVDLVLLSEGMDPYSPQAVRNAAGALFSLPVHILPEEAIWSFLEAQGLFLVAATPEGERVYWEGDYRRGTAFLLGSEAEGLPQRWRQEAHARVRIPMAPGVDSLNVAVSAALLLYEARRQRENFRTP